MQEDRRVGLDLAFEVRPVTPIPARPNRIPLFGPYAGSLSVISAIEKNALRIRELYADIDSTFHKQPHGPEHHAACARFHAEYDALAFPGGLNQGMKRLKAGDGEAIETALQFLEADARFFRSGYIKEEILRRLKHCDLSSIQKHRLARLILRSIDHGGLREFRGYSRLSPIVFSAQLLDAIQARLPSDHETARRAADVLHVLRSQGVIV